MIYCLRITRTIGFRCVRKSNPCDIAPAIYGERARARLEDFFKLIKLSTAHFEVGRNDIPDISFGTAEIGLTLCAPGSKSGSLLSLSCFLGLYLLDFPALVEDLSWSLVSVYVIIENGGYRRVLICKFSGLAGDCLQFQVL